MFKLIKLAFYVVIGYALYELYQGFKEGSPMMSGEGRGQNLTGEGEGMEERSEEPSGMSASHKVATVTYTLKLDPAFCSYEVYATASQGDNRGLFSFSVDLSGTLQTLANRSPAGTFEVDPLDPNYNPSWQYPTKYAGFGADRSASAATGIVSGAHDLAKGGDLVRVYGFGYLSNDMSNYHPPPDTSSGASVRYGDYIAAAGTDGRFGDSFLPTLGSLRVISGQWTGVAPRITTASAQTSASVWSLEDQADPDKHEPAMLVFQTLESALPPPVDSVGLSSTFPTFNCGTVSSSNAAAGGAIAVSGSNGRYVSEVDPLLDPPQSRGSAPIAIIGNEAGNIYVMAKLRGAPTEIAAVLASLTQDVDGSDPQYAALKATYDPLFGDDGFNALFKFFNGTSASKIFNWNFAAHPNVTVDQLAVVPEPGAMLAALGGVMLLARRRR